MISKPLSALVSEHIDQNLYWNVKERMLQLYS